MQATTGSILIVLCLLWAVQIASSANILIYMVMCSYSHRLSLWPYVEDLTKAGHKVTVISPYDNKNPDPTINEYVPRLWQKSLGEGDWNELIDLHKIRKNNEGWKFYWDLLKIASNACEYLYKDEDFVEWFRKSHFDLVIMDGAVNECVYPMVHHWKAKLLIYTTTNMMSWYYDQFGLPDETSSITDTMYGFPPGVQMSFPQRFLNAMAPLVWKAVREWYYFPRLESISTEGLKKVTGKSVEFPNIGDIEKNTSLVFISAHYSMSYPRSYPPLIIPVGGVVVSKETKPLPKDLQDFIGNSDFIYVSLGSVTEFTKLPQQIQDDFVNAINSFPHIKFIWKTQTSIKPKVPLKHVKFVSWAPQVSLLVHPKNIGFITHAGMGSITEAIQFGVPLVMFPLFHDQDMNAIFIVSNGGGIKLEITDLKQKELENAVMSITTNPKYRESMKKLSVMFHDRPMTAKQTALWWTEFVLRHENVHEFLRPPSVEQSWYVKRQLDVWLVATIISLLILGVPSYILLKIVKKMVMSFFCKSSNDQAKMKSKKNN